jgi:hypothetical protein
MPSFGSSEPPEAIAPTLRQVAEVLRNRAPFVMDGNKSLPYLVLHVSQQSETFFFGRGPDGAGAVGAKDWYWRSLMGWHEMLMQAQLPMDFIFDAHLTDEELSRYQVVVLPLSLALSDAQAGVLSRFVENGGLLVTGPFVGRCDAEGEVRHRGVLCQLVDDSDVAVPDPAHIEGPLTDLRATMDGSAETILRQIDRFSATKSRVARGHVLAFRSDIGYAYATTHSPALKAAAIPPLKTLAPPPIEVIGPASLHIGAYRESDNSIHIHLHHFAPADAEPLTGIEILVRNVKLVNAKRLLESPGALQWETGEGVARVLVGSLELHDVVSLAVSE